MEEDLKVKATEFEDIEEVWLLHVGHCRKNTSIHDQIEEEGVLLYKR